MFDVRSLPQIVLISQLTIPNVCHHFCPQFVKGRLVRDKSMLTDEPEESASTSGPRMSSHVLNRGSQPLQSLIRVENVRSCWLQTTAVFSVSPSQSGDGQFP